MTALLITLSKLSYWSTKIEIFVLSPFRKTMRDFTRVFLSSSLEEIEIFVGL